jgi:hypothetical protein
VDVLENTKQFAIFEYHNNKKDMETKNEKTFTEQYQGKNGTFTVTVKVFQKLTSGQSFENQWLWDAEATITCPDGQVMKCDSNNFSTYELNTKYNAPMTSPLRIPVKTIYQEIGSHKEVIMRGSLKEQRARAQWERAERNQDFLHNA